MRRAVKRGVENFIADDCPTQAAALAFFAIFSMPPLLVVVMSIGEFLIEGESVRRQVSTWAWTTLGRNAAQEVEKIIWSASRPGGPPNLAAILSVLALVFSSTTAFTKLQDSLNLAWKVPEPDRPMWKAYLFKRFISFGLVVTVGVVALLSLVVSTILSAVIDRLGLPHLLPEAGSLVLSWVGLTILLAVLFRYLPDTDVLWRHALSGAMVTAGLFAISKQLMGIYLARSDIGGAYGSAGSLVLLLFWFYFASSVLLFGAELTHAWGAQSTAEDERA